MPDFRIRAGDTDATIYVRLRDSTTGLAKTGIAYDDAGAVCSYTLPLAARAAITLATQTVTGAHADGGFVEVDAVNCKGLYRLDLTDAAVASGDYTIISIEFDGVIEESIHIPLAIEPTLFTMSAQLTTVASDTLAIEADTNELQGDWTNAGRLDAILDTIYSDTTVLETDWVNGGRLDLILDTIASDTLAIEADTNELQTDWANAGRLDAILDTIYSDTTLLVPAVSDVRSALVVTDAVVDTIYSDTTVLVPAVSDVKSALVVADAVIDTIYSDTTVLVPAVSDVKSALVIADAIIDTIYSDTTILEADWVNGGRLDLILDIVASDTKAIEATGGALTAAQASDLVAIESKAIVIDNLVSDVKSALVVTDAVVDTIYSDTTALVTAVSDVKSALVVTDAVVDTVYSDTTIIVADWLNGGRLDLILDIIASDTLAIEACCSDVASKVVVMDAVVDTIYSDTTVLVPAVSDVKSALVVADTEIDKIYSDTAALSAASNPPKIIGGWGYDGTSYFWNASLLIDGLIISSGVSAPAVVGVYGNNGETDLGYSEGTAPGVQTKHSVGGSFTLSTLPASGNPAYLEITLVYAAVTYTARLYAWGR